MRAVAIIPARGGSRRIPRKNVRSFFGRPIIAYSIETAQASGLFGNGIFVSTDDIEIAATAKMYGAWALMRSSEMARDEVGTQEVTKDALEAIRQRFPDHPLPDYACCIYATAPLMRAQDLIDGYWQVANLGPSHEYSMSVGAHPLRDAGQWYWGRRRAFVEGLELVKPYTAMVPIPEDRVCDINTLYDWSRAEEMYANLHNLRV